MGSPSATHKQERSTHSSELSIISKECSRADDMLDDEIEEAGKDYTVESRNTSVNEAGLDEVDQDESTITDLAAVDEDAKKRILDAQVLNLDNAKTCEHVAKSRQVLRVLEEGCHKIERSSKG